MATPALEDSASDRCSNPECRVAQDGRCLEGFENKAECPQFGKHQIGQKKDVEDSSLIPMHGVAMPASTTLSVEEADNVIKRKEARVIAITGPFDAGKTSLIAGLYDLFNLGPVGSVAFGQSYSLQAFEEAAHDSRATSRRETPETNRTPRGEIRFYHFELFDKSTGAAPTVLLGDRAGEEYLETRNNIDLAKAFPELPRADVLTVLIDGQRLLDAGERHNVRSEARQTIQAFVEAEVVRNTQCLAVVLTKLDALRKSADSGNQAMQDFAMIVQRLRATYGVKFAAIESCAVAAQPKSDGAKQGEGLEQLLAYWMMEPRRYQPNQVKVALPQTDRYFALLSMTNVGGIK
jgi:hypothetical protein